MVCQGLAYQSESRRSQNVQKASVFQGIFLCKALYCKSQFAPRGFSICITYNALCPVRSWAQMRKENPSAGEKSGRNHQEEQLRRCPSPRTDRLFAIHVNCTENFNNNSTFDDRDIGCDSCKCTYLLCISMKLLLFLYYFKLLFIQLSKCRRLHTPFCKVHK